MFCLSGPDAAAKNDVLGLALRNINLSFVALMSLIFLGVIWSWMDHILLIRIQCEMMFGVCLADIFSLLVLMFFDVFLPTKNR